MGWLYEPELTGIGKAPQVPARFLEQVAQWTSHQRWREEKVETPDPGVISATTQEPPSLSTTMTASMDTESMAPATDTAVTLPEESLGQPRVKAKYLWLAAAAVVVLGAGGGLLWWLGKPPPLEVSTEPPGAQVIMDGVSLGVTPLKIEGVARDAPHAMELNLKGMRTWSRSFEPGSLRARLEVVLEPFAAPAPPPEPPPPRRTSPPGSARTRCPPASPWRRSGTPSAPRCDRSSGRSTRSGATRCGPRAPTRAMCRFSENDLRNGRTPASSRSGEIYVFLEGEGADSRRRLFMASAEPHTLPKAEALHAFVLVGITAERNKDRNLTLHVRDNTSGDESLMRLDTRRNAHQVALENRFSIRRLEPDSWYTLEVRPRQGAPMSAVAVLVVLQERGAGAAVGAHGGRSPLRPCTGPLHAAGRPGAVVRAPALGR